MKTKILLVVVAIVVVIGVAFFFTETASKSCFPNCENMTEAEKETIRAAILQNVKDQSNPLITAKPVLGSQKWFPSVVRFYPPNFLLVDFDDGHIAGQYYAKYTVTTGPDAGLIVNLTKIDELMTTETGLTLQQKIDLESVEEYRLY